MMMVIPIPAIGAGIAAGLLYHAISAGLIYGVTAPSLPLFVLALSGMSYGRPGITTAVATAVPFVLFLVPFYDGLLLVMTQLVPLTLFIRRLMVAHRDPNEAVLRFSGPVPAISAVGLYMALFFALVIATDSTLYRYLRERLQEVVAPAKESLDPPAASAVANFLTEMPHVILALESWFFAVLLVLITWLAHAVAESLGRVRRPALRLSRASPPNQVLAALGVAGLMGFTGIEQVMHAGQAAGLILLVPYLFAGLGTLHHSLLKLQGGAAWLFGFYVLSMVTTGWPFVLLTLFGLIQHLSRYTRPSDGSG